MTDKPKPPDDDEALSYKLSSPFDSGLRLEEDPIELIAPIQTGEGEDESLSEPFPDTWPALSGESPTELSEETVRNACLRLQQLLEIFERKCAAVRKVSENEIVQNSHFEKQEGKQKIFQLLNEVLSYIRVLTESERIDVKFRELTKMANNTTNRFGGDPRKAPSFYGPQFNAFSIMTDHDLKNIVKAAQEVFPDLALASSAAPAPAPAASATSPSAPVPSSAIVSTTVPATIARTHESPQPSLTGWGPPKQVVQRTQDQVRAVLDATHQKGGMWDVIHQGARAGVAGAISRNPEPEPSIKKEKTEAKNPEEAGKPEGKEESEQSSEEPKK